jgi:TonB family protein
MASVVKRVTMSRVGILLPGLFVAGSNLVSSPALALEKTHVPSGTWAVEYARTYCVLSRDGLAGEPGVAFRTRPVADRHDLLLFLPPTAPPTGPGQGRLTPGNGPPGPPRFVDDVLGKDKAHRFIKTTISQAEFNAAAKAGYLRIAADGKFDVRAALPNMPKAFAALRACEDDMIARWGLTRSDLEGWVTPPKPKVRWRNKMGPWPDWSLERARNQVSFKIDAMGQSSDCKIIISSGSEKFDAALCNAVRKMKFRPALDASGKPVRSAQLLGAYWSFDLR